MTVAVEVNEIGLHTVRQVEQPFARAIDVLPRLIHPFQSVIAFKNPQILSTSDFAMLLRSKPRAHGGDNDLDSVWLKRTRQFKRKGPDAADGIGCH